MTNIETIDYKLLIKEVFVLIDSGEPPRSWILKGDISGIQDFIFNVKTNGAAKALKARSNYVKLICDRTLEFLQEIFRNSGIETNLLYNGGGNFFVEIINGEFNIESLQKIIDIELKDDEIYLSLSKVELSESFDSVWSDLKQVSNWNKLQKFRRTYSHISSPKQFNHLNGNNSRWKSLMKEFVDDKLVEHKGILFGNSISIRDIAENNTLPKFNADNIELGVKNDEKVAIGSTVPFDSLAEFAKHRTGTAKLGILKMDVDNLGTLFGEQKDIGALSKLAKNIKEFFDIKVPEILKLDNDKGKPFIDNIYTVFSGGDDCFFVGAWDYIMDFSIKLNSEFMSFAQQLKVDSKSLSDKQISLSAGIVIVDNKYPVVQFSELAEEVLSKAKSRKANNELVKNAVCIFDEILTWNEFEKARENSNILLKLLTHKDESKRESKALLERIKKSAKGYSRLQRMALNNQLPFPKIWRLKYYIARNVKKENKSEIDALFEKYIINLRKAFERKEETNPMIYPIAARWAEFLTRNKQYNGISQ